LAEEKRVSSSWWRLSHDLPDKRLQRKQDIARASGEQGCIKLGLANATKVPGRVDGAVLLSSSSSSS
jgi:hypothetical protein